MTHFQPDYRYLVDAACNRIPARLPLYEHLIDWGVMEQILGIKFAHLYSTDKRAFFREYCRFFREMGYDTVSYECCICSILVDGGALGSPKPGAIKSREDFERYPWDSLLQRWYDAFAPDLEALRLEMPEGMKAVGGVGNGVFEVVQDLVGYMELCYLRDDDPQLYVDLFEKAGQIELAIWKRFLQEFGDIYCVCRFGDDLGYKSSTLLPPQEIRDLIIPQYRRIIEAVHESGKPFLLHSCGCIFAVMEDLIAAGIDAKHSNEDQIALFPEWPERYGDRIAFFGGIDTDAVCRLPKEEMTAYIQDVVGKCQGKYAFAFSTGNSIPGYVPADQYLHMVRTLRTLRGEKHFMEEKDIM